MTTALLLLPDFALILLGAAIRRWMHLGDFLAMHMGGDGRTVAWLISATTLASMVTLPVWATWVANH